MILRRAKMMLLSFYPSLFKHEQEKVCQIFTLILIHLFVKNEASHIGGYFCHFMKEFVFLAHIYDSMTTFFTFF